MLNVVVYCLRLESKQRGVLTSLEKQRAELVIIKSTQQESFVELVSKLEDNTGENVKHDLAKLSPSVDSDNILRLRGRLSRTTISDDLKHSILLATKHPAVVLMLREMHEVNHYERTECVRSQVQKRFWVIGLRDALRSIKSKCVRCRGLAVQPIHPHMADLPKE